jgi:hypothetical protein
MVAMRRNQLGLVVAAAVLGGAVLGGASIVVWQRVRPRLPTLASATPTLDRAIAAVVAAVGDDAAVAVTALVPSVSCTKTPLAKGNVYTRTADLYTDTGQEGTVIDRIAAGLPAGEQPQRRARAGGGVSSLTADLGGGIHLQILPVSPGWLAATATTDCRAGGQTQPVAGADPAPETGPITQLLGALDAIPAGFHTDSVACLSGRIVTLDAISQPTDTANLRDRVARLLPPGARQFSSTSNRVAWRDQNVSTIVASSDDGTQITVQRTAPC